MIRGWLPETAGAGSLGLNGSGDAAVVMAALPNRQYTGHVKAIEEVDDQ